MRKIKYVVFAPMGFDDEKIVLFPDFIAHNLFKEVGEIVSAGFVGRSTTTRSGFYCYGGSDSLKLKSREEDQVLLDLMMKDEFV